MHGPFHEKITRDYLNLAETYRDKGLYELSNEHFELAMTSIPHLPNLDNEVIGRIYNEHAKLLRDHGRSREALESLKMAREAFPYNYSNRSSKLLLEIEKSIQEITKSFEGGFENDRCGRRRCGPRKIVKIILALLLLKIIYSKLIFGRECHRRSCGDDDLSNHVGGHQTSHSECDRYKKWKCHKSNSNLEPFNKQDLQKQENQSPVLGRDKAKKAQDIKPIKVNNLNQTSTQASSQNTKEAEKKPETKVNWLIMGLCLAVSTAGIVL